MENTLRGLGRFFFFISNVIDELHCKEKSQLLKLDSFLYILKAFDGVWHADFLHKLKFYGVFGQMV